MLNNLMLHMIMSLLVLMSGLDHLEQPNLALPHNDICYAIGKVNQQPLKWILWTLSIIRFKEGKTHLGAHAKQKLLLFYYMDNILLEC
uniref:Secreted protein n=1 Tax=Lactuca sativa TaxID=4236 RepID=A0A9R1W125_LACSA|nr:hypothetical protein LSAT_V11C400184230 [Lactuca sativa]